MKKFGLMLGVSLVLLARPAVFARAKQIPSDPESARRRPRRGPIPLKAIHRDEIAAELRGMVERWKEAGTPLDNAVKHPFSVWAKTVGGILKVSGFAGFLANYGTLKLKDEIARLQLTPRDTGSRDAVARG